MALAQWINGKVKRCLATEAFLLEDHLLLEHTISAEVESPLPGAVIARCCQVGLQSMHAVIAQSSDRCKLYCRRWSLNWDTITPEIVVGSCPRSASDIDRMVDEAGISAIICLQVSNLAQMHTACAHYRNLGIRPNCAVAVGCVLRSHAD